MELSKNSEIRKPNDTGIRTQIPPDYFRTPCTNIASVDRMGSDYIVRDTANRQVKRFPVVTYGELCGNGNDFLIFKKGGGFQIFDSTGRRNGPILSSQTIGEFRGVSGQNITFLKGSAIYTYDKNFRRVCAPRPATY
jgi:hypothetical protein